MERLYTLRIEPTAVAHAAFIAEATNDRSLGEIHDAIERHVGIRGGPDWYFCLADLLEWRRSSYGEAPWVRRSAAATRIGRLALSFGATFWYVADTSDGQLFTIEVVDIDETPGGESVLRWRWVEAADQDVSGSSGEQATGPQAPEAAVAGEEVREDGPLPGSQQDSRPVPTEMPADLAQAVRQAVIDTGWSDPDARKTGEAALALLEWVGTDSNRLAEATRATGKALEDWLTHLHFDLAKAGLVDEAAQVARRAARLSNESVYLGDRAVILAEAGRRDEALAQVEENLRRFPDDVWTKIFAGDAHSALDDDQRAEALWRRALDEADCEYDRLGAFERLEDLLRPAGRDAEADALAEWARRRGSAPGARGTAASGSASASASADTSGAGATGARKKVGRNEPCPCGSGKKYKKCCGSAGKSAPAVRPGEVIAALHGEATHWLSTDELQSRVDTAITWCLGESYAGLRLDEVLPLLPSGALEDFFIDWLLLDEAARGDAKAPCLMDEFLHRCRHRLDPRVADMAEHLVGSRLGLYRVAGAEAGERGTVSLEAMDPPGEGGEVEVTWIAAGAHPEPGTVLLGRLANRPEPGKLVIAALPVLHHSQDLDELRSLASMEADAAGVAEGPPVSEWPLAHLLVGPRRASPNDPIDRVFFARHADRFRERHLAYLMRATLGRGGAGRRLRSGIGAGR